MRRTEVKNILPIGRIEGSKTPIKTHTPLIRYFINDVAMALIKSGLECEERLPMPRLLAEVEHRTYIIRKEN